MAKSFGEYGPTTYCPSSPWPTKDKGICSDRDPQVRLGKVDGEVVDISKIPNAVDGKHYVNYTLAPGEYLLQCPYEISHCILPMRMGNHLFRCRRNYAKQLREKGLPEQRLVHCQWNPAHVVEEKEIAYHSKQCSDRNKTKEELRSHLQFAPKNKLPLPKGIELSFEEDWDNDPPRFLSYDPKIKMESELIIYQPKMMSKAEKMAWREKQRWRWFYEASGTGVFASYRNERLERLHAQGLGPLSSKSEDDQAISVKFSDKTDSQISDIGACAIRGQGPAIVTENLEDILALTMEAKRCRIG